MITTTCRILWIPVSLPWEGGVVTPSGRWDRGRRLGCTAATVSPQPGKASASTTTRGNARRPIARGSPAEPRGFGLRGCQLLRRRPGPPAITAGLGERADRVVVREPPAEGVGVVGLDAGAVVLRPVADAELAVVVLDLVDPALAHERDVAHDARGGEAGEVAHDR